MKTTHGKLRLLGLCIGIVITAGVAWWLAGVDQPEQTGQGRGAGLRKAVQKASTAAVPGVAAVAGAADIDWQAVPVTPVRLGPFQERLLKDARLLEQRRVEAAAGKPARELRLWRTDFKYPLVREEAWLLRDKKGRETVVRREFSVADHAMLRFPGEVTAAEVAAWAKKRGLHLRHALRTTPVWLVAAADATLDTAQRIISAFERDFPAAGLAVAERDYLVFPTLTPNDLSFTQLWGLNNAGQTGGVPDADIDAPEAWDLATGSREVLVGVIDTGIDRTHPDLAANMWTNPREIPGNGVDDDGNGFVDDRHGWDFFADDNDPMDENNHGTHCAGTIGGVGNNQNGVTGVCWQVSMVGIRFLGPNGGTTSDAVDSVNYARLIGVNLTSNSWGGGGYSALLLGAVQAADAAGQLFVAAAGNDGLNTDLMPNYPSGYPVAGIVAVAACTDRDARASFSNYGAASVDLAAPGSAIYSTILGGGYASFNGTSMATPHVAGAAALLLSVAPNLPAAEIKTRLMSTVDVLPAFTSTTVARGRLNLARLIQQSAGPRPLVQISSVREAEGGGNGDGVLNPGETLELYFNVTNRGTETAQNVQLRIAPVAAASAFTVLRGELPAGTLAAGASFASPTPFQVRSSASTATPLAEELEITLTYGSPARTLTQRHSLYLLTSAYVEGRVTDAATGAALEGAEVRLAGPSTLTVKTDAEGRYRVLATDGSYQATAAAPGFLTSAPVSVSVPPGRAGVDFSLGIPQLAITPPVVEAGLYSGRAETRRLELRNLGSAPLTWNLRLSSQPPVESAALPLTVLPGRLVHPERPDGDTGPRSFYKPVREELLPELAAPLGVLTGVTVGLVATTWDRGVLVADLSERGAAVVTLGLPLSPTALAGVDVLIADDAVSGMSAEDIALIRARVSGGMGLLCEADDSTSMGVVNTLFQGTGITAAYDGFRDVTYTDIRPHPMTAGVARLVEISVGASAVVSGQAQTLVGAGSLRAHAAVARLGGGLMLFIGNEITDEANFVSGDGRRFANQVVEGLAAGPPWLSASPLFGTLAPGLTQIVELRLDPAQVVSGRHEAYAVFQTNIPDEGPRVVPVGMNVADAPELAVSAAALDFGSLVEGVPAERVLTVSNTGTLDLQVSQMAVAGEDAAQFQVSPAGAFTLAPGAAQTLTVSLSPDSPRRPTRAELVLESNDPLLPTARVPLSGQRQLAPDALASPARISLQLRDGEVGAATVTLRNRGKGPLLWQAALETETGGAPVWATLPGISGTYAAGASGQVRLLVDAAAAGPGDHACTLVLTTNDVDTPALRVPVSLRVLAVPIVRHEVAHDVGEVRVGQPADYQVMVRNAGSAPLILGPGVVVSSSIKCATRFPQVVPPGGELRLDFVITARTAGRQSATAVILTNARSGPLWLRLSGKAKLGPRMTVAPKAVTLTLAPGLEQVRWLRVSNTGDEEADWTAELEDAPAWAALEGETPSLKARQYSQLGLRLGTYQLPPGLHTCTLALTQAGSGMVIRVPVRLTVKKAAALVLTPPTIHLPRAWAGYVENSSFRCENQGNQPLTLRALRASHTRLALTDGAPSLPLILQPGEVVDVPFTFTTEAVGKYSDAFFITTSAAPSRPVRLPVTSVVARAPVLSVTPASLDVEVEPGTEAAPSLTLANTGSDVLEWTAAVRNGVGPARDLPAVLAAVKASPTLLTGLLPASHTLSEGVTGDAIANGGAGMYYGGNRIATNLASGQFFQYSDGVVAASPSAGAEGRYFTLKSGALWMLAAHLDGASRFSISGGLGTPTTARVTGGSVTRTVAGVAYRGFYKRVIGPPVPSVNHLIIVEDRPGLAQTFDAARPTSDFHEVSGLSGQSRVYYLMFGLNGSQPYPESSFSLLMDTFLRQMLHPESPDWLTLGADTGGVVAGTSSTLGLVLSPAQLLPGMYGATVSLSTNSPVTSTVQVPVMMRVPGRAVLVAAPARFDFPDTFLGRQSELECTLRNPGNQPLVIETIQPTDAAYTVHGVSTPLTVPRGGTATFTLRFRPGQIVSLPAQLVIQSNAHGQPELRLPITGKGLRGPLMTLEPGAITTTLEPGASEQHVLTVGNQGDAMLSWSASPSTSLSALVSTTPSSGLVATGSAQQPVLSIVTTATTPAGRYSGSLLVAGNDAVTPFISLPVSVTVPTRPRGVLSRTDLPFGGVIVGATASSGIVIKNVGNAPLEVTGCTITGGPFAIFGAVLPLTIPVGGSRTLSVRFSPGAEVAYEGELRFATTAPALPAELVLRVTGHGTPPPVLSVLPASGVEAVLKKGQSLTPTLTVRNDGGSTLSWSASITDMSTVSGTLENVLQRLYSSYQDITSLIPDLFYFQGGDTGTSIYDGGNDMYDYGNYLGTNLGGFIPYSASQVTTTYQLGTGGRYFTRKFPGVFLFAADFGPEVTSFNISGNLGADGQGAVTAAVIDRSHGGREYTGFLKSVHGAWDSSVNHLIIVERRESLSRTYSTNTDSDEHAVTGLFGGRLYHLLFSRSDGLPVDAALAGQIMDVFLEKVALPPTTNWAAVSPAYGHVLPGASAVVNVPLQTRDLPPGLHTARVSFQGNVPGAGTLQLPLSLTVLEPDFTTSPRRLELMKVQDVSPALAEVVVTAREGLSPAWTAVGSAPWLVLSKTSGTGSDVIGVSAGASLPPGTYNGSVNVTVDGATQSVPVALIVRATAYTQLITDHRQPGRLLGLIRGMQGVPSLLVPLDAATLAPGQPLTLPADVTDADLTPEGARLYAISFSGHSITEVDMDAFRVTRSRALPVTLDAGTTDPYHYDVEAGRPGIVYYTDAAQAPMLHVFDFEAGEDLSTFRLNSGAGIGDFTVSPDGNTIHAVSQSTWSGAGTVTVARINSAGVYLAQTHLAALSLPATPLRGEAFFSANRDALFTRAWRYTPLLDSRQEYTRGPVVAASAYGHALVMPDALVDGMSGTTLATLPAGIAAAAFTAAQDAVVYQHPTQLRPVRMPLADLATLPSVALRPGVADGSTISISQGALSWSGLPTAASYDIYLGTQADAVASATTSTAGVFRLNTTGVSYTLPVGGLYLGGTYYWRVDARAPDGTVVRGPVWSFTVASVQGVLSGPVPACFPGGTAQGLLSITTAAPSTAWTLAETAPWLTLGQAAGTGPAAVTLSFAPGSLAQGTHTTNVVLRSGTQEQQVAVTLRVLGQPNISLPRTDPVLSAAYAVHTEAAESFLLWIDPATAAVRHVLPLGWEARDLLVQAHDDRLYVLRSTGIHVTAVQRQNERSVISTWSSASAALRLFNGPVGRIVLMTTGSLRLHHSGTGGQVGLSVNVPSNGTAAGPADGRFILVGSREGTSNGGLSRYEIGSTAITSGASVSIAAVYQPNLLLSGDGSRAFFDGTPYDASTLAALGPRITVLTLYACSWTGHVVWSDSNAFAATGGAPLGSLSLTARALAATPDHQHLLIITEPMNALVRTTPHVPPP